MDINRSGYYKWKYRKAHPSTRHIQRMKDVEYIKEQSSKHKAHGYRWLAAFLKKNQGVIMSPEYIYRCTRTIIAYASPAYQLHRHPAGLCRYRTSERRETLSHAHVTENSSRTYRTSHTQETAHCRHRLEIPSASILLEAYPCGNLETDAGKELTFFGYNDVQTAIYIDKCGNQEKIGKKPCGWVAHTYSYKSPKWNNNHTYQHTCYHL